MRSHPSGHHLRVDSIDLVQRGNSHLFCTLSTPSSYCLSSFRIKNLFDSIPNSLDSCLSTRSAKHVFGQVDTLPNRLRLKVLQPHEVSGDTSFDNTCPHTYLNRFCSCNVWSICVFTRSLRQSVNTKYSSHQVRAANVVCSNSLGHVRSQVKDEPQCIYCCRLVVFIYKVCPSTFLCLLFTHDLSRNKLC